MLKNNWLSIGLIVAGCGFSGAARAETLQEALAFAYTGNPTIEAQRARLRASDEQVPQALANWRPTVKLSGDAARTNTYSKSPSSAFNPATLTNNQIFVSQGVLASGKDVSLTVSQPIYRGGRTVAQTKRAEAQVLADRAALAVTEQTVLLNVVTAYLNVVQYQAVLDLSINNEQVLQRQLDATNDRFRVGEVTRTDVAQAESRLSAAHADRTQAAGNLRAAEANYVNVVGHPPEKLEAPGVVPGLPRSIEQARELALAENPNVANAAYNYDVAQHGIDLVAGELLPTVTLNGQALRNYEYEGPKTFERIYQASVNLTVPLYQQGQEYSRLRAQKHTAGQMRIDVDVAKRDIVESVTKAWESLATARARITSYTDQISAARIALEGVQRESQVGSRTVLDVLNAEQELLNARVNLVQAQHDETVAAYQVKSTVGQLTAQALALPVPIYDPTKHYDEVRDQWIGTEVAPTYGAE
ncbi:MAG TPA: TolC family outer membrane protein [Telmatospirillum sp.]|nr:TolC family outer membrane protein [Telmatospirillum sp.]